MKKLLLAAVLVFCATPLPAQLTLTEATNFSVDASSDGRLAIDVLGTIWVLPRSGGKAMPIASGLLPARRPRWSPAGDAIVYQASAPSQTQLWLYRFDEQQARNISDGRFFDQQPSWHPDGSRIVYSSDRHDRGFDLWELDLPTGLSWRLSHRHGDETEPAWSADGRHLVYISRQGDRWSLVLRRRGEAERILVSSAERLSSPSWRPDGSLVTFVRHGAAGLAVEMAILSEPVLVRPLLAGEDFFVAPVSWADRQTLLYTADGAIRQRDFNAWTSRKLPFRVTVEQRPGARPAGVPARSLPLIDAPAGQRVIRTARLYDGLDDGYRHGLDIVIDGGLITAIEPPRERPGAILIELSDLTALPGYVDSYARLPADAADTLGPLLLSFGVTTLVAEFPDAPRRNRLWSGAAMPGPRILRAQPLSAPRRDELPWLVSLRGDVAAGATRQSRVRDWQKRGVPVLAENWQLGVGSGASMVMGVASLPASPAGRRYADLELAGGRAMTIVSGLADARTPGLAALFNSRNAKLLPPSPGAIRRFSETPDLGSAGNAIVLGSHANGMPPGIAQHAEFRALAAAGVTGPRLLKTAGVNAAVALGLAPRLGRLAPGSAADIVLVDGDPLSDPASLARVVAVIRNGRFFSVVGLLDRVAAAPSVE